MKKVDSYTINKIGIPSLALIERAALGIKNVLIKQFQDKETSIVAICGIGNNGADALAVLRMLYIEGYTKIAVCIIGDEDGATDEFKVQNNVIKNLNIKSIQQNEISEYYVVIDGIFGIGLNRVVEGQYAGLINNVNSENHYVISVDIPSGINGDSGNVMGVAIQANETITFGDYKLGIILYPGAEYSGRVTVADIGFPSEAYNECEILKSYEVCDMPRVKKDRPLDSNKGTFGKLLIIAGNEEMSGAACLATSAAFSMGCGLVRVATPEVNRVIIASTIPEAIVYSFAQDKDKLLEDISNLIECSDVILAGPGMGVSKRTQDLLQLVLESKKPAVIDADAINTISKMDGLRQLLHENVIITPHLGEMSRLNGKGIDEIKYSIVSTCQDVAKQYGIICVLKGARTVISDKKGQTFINMTGNSGMAKAGSGDVLAGMIAGLLSTHYDVLVAASLGAYLHGVAGDESRDEWGEMAMVPRDMIKAIERILKENQ